MKKLVSGLLAAACIATMSVGVMAADISAVKGPDYKWTLNNGTYSVQVDGLTKGNRYGLLAIKADAVLATVSDTDIMYIDQATATGESGTITFNGSGNGFLPKDPLDYDVAGYKLYIGGYDEDGSATQIGVLAAPKTVHATSVTLNKEKLSLTLGGEPEKLTATIKPTDAVEKTVEWSSSDPSVAYVDKVTGEVTALKAGEAVITATVVGVDNVTATCDVTVTEKPATIDITGKVIDKTVPGKSATVTVYDADGNSLGSGTTSPKDGTYTVAVVPGSGYKIVVSKKAYCTYTITGVPAEDAIAIKDIDISMLAGDVVVNGEVKLPDLRAVLGDYNKTSGLANENSDVDQNGEVKLPDLRAILNCYNKVSITEEYVASAQ